MNLVNPRLTDGSQWRFACRRCSGVKVADERTHSDGPGYFICGECLGIHPTEKVTSAPKFMAHRTAHS